MAQVVGPVNSTANYADNVFSGVWSSGYLFARDQPILVEITYGIPGAPSDIIHDLPCPAGQSVDLTAPSSQRYPNIAITQVRFKSQGSQPATVTGYFAEPRAPGIIAGIGGTFGATALLNLSAHAFTGGVPTSLGLPSFQLPGQYGGFWLGTTGQTNHVDVLVQTQSGTTPIGGVVSGEVYGFSGGNAGFYAVPSLGSTVDLTVTSSTSQNVNLAAVPIAVWPPPQFDNATQNNLLTYQSAALGAGGDTYILPPYDGDANIYVENTTTSEQMVVELRQFRNDGVQLQRETIMVLADANVGLFPQVYGLAIMKLSHRINAIFVNAPSVGHTYNIGVMQVPRRGGS